MIPPDAEARRLRTLHRLEAEDVFVQPGLTRLPGEGEVRLPGTEAVALRALALVLVACEATGVGQWTVDALIDEYRPPFSAAEWRWFESPMRASAETLELGWRFEAALPLLWAVGLAETLKRPDAQTEPIVILEPLARGRRDALLARAELRPTAEILDLADLHFCYECASRLALGEGQGPPAGLDGGILLERHRAFTWLTEGGGDWDDLVARA